MSETGRIRIGMSGWRFDEWRGSFYPEKLAQKRELEWASRQLNSIELNGTFHSLQKPKSYLEWNQQTPDDFVFAVKGTQFITHIRKLDQVATPLANFLGQGLLRLGQKLGPILWQLPPVMKFDAARLEEFFKLLPRTHKQAAAYAKQRDEWMAERCWLEVEPELEDVPVRYAMEARHKSFADPEYVALLRQYNIALVVADTDKWPRMMDVTADFVYCRLHGMEEVYPNGYDAAGIEAWAQRVMAWSRGEEVMDGVHVHPELAPKREARDVFVYFDDDVKVRAPHDAVSLTKRISEMTEAA